MSDIRPLLNEFDTYAKGALATLSDEEIDIRAENASEVQAEVASHFRHPHEAISIRASQILAEWTRRAEARRPAFEVVSSFVYEDDGAPF